MFFLSDSSNNNIRTTDSSTEPKISDDFILNEKETSIKNVIGAPSAKNSSISLNTNNCNSKSSTADIDAVIDLPNDSDSEKISLNQTSNDDKSVIKNHSSKEIKIYDTVEEFERNLPKTVTILNTPFGSKVYLVGTAHFSEESQNDVSFVIQNVKPDVVLVELCQARTHILSMDEETLLEETKNFNFEKVRVFFCFAILELNVGKY